MAREMCFNASYVHDLEERDTRYVPTRGTMAAPWPSSALFCRMSFCDIRRYGLRRAAMNIERIALTGSRVSTLREVESGKVPKSQITPGMLSVEKCLCEAIC